jgi:hypothetical protein
MSNTIGGSRTPDQPLHTRAERFGLSTKYLIAFSKFGFAGVKFDDSQNLDFNPARAHLMNMLPALAGYFSLDLEGLSRVVIG